MIHAFQRTLALVSTALTAAFVSAQFTDDFEDGSLTDGPVWTGSATFEAAAGKLHLNDVAAGTSYLQSDFAMPSLDNMEWRVQVRQNFAPSANNYGRVYLASDQADLTGPLNGYFLQFGENGSLDAVELFEQNGTNTVSVCRGTDGQIAAAFIVGIRVMRDGTGTWSLWVDPAGGTNYALEASGSDGVFTSSLHLGVRCTYTVSNVANFYYDDVYAGPTIVDTTPPAIVSAVAPLAGFVDVTFNEPLDQTTANTASNYVLDNGIGPASSATLSGLDPTLVHLALSTTLTSGTTYTLTVNGVQDPAANACVNATTSFLYFVPEVAQPGDVIINELMADPTPVVGLPDAEFVEIHNRTINKTFDLANWTITDGSTVGTLPSVTLPPGGFVIVTSAGNAPFFTGSGTVAGCASFPSLNNDGDPLSLKNDSGVEIDAISYDLGWYHDNAKALGGWTLERIDPTTPCSSESNWTASVDPDGGTPGVENSVYAVVPDNTAPSLTSVFVNSATQIELQFSEPMNTGSLASGDYTITPPVPINLATAIAADRVQLSLGTALTIGEIYHIAVTAVSDCPGNSIGSANALDFALPEAVDSGDVVINEVLYDPVGTGSDFVELYNRSDKVLSVANWKLAHTVNGAITDPTTITTAAFLLMPGQYVLITANPADIAARYPLSHTDRFVQATMPTYNNGNGTVVLEDPNGALLDRFDYNDDLHFALLNKTEGVSLERVSPDRPTSDPTNWHSAAETSGFATPGYQNSQFSETVSTSGELSIARKIFSPDNDGYEDVLTIGYSFKEPGFTGTLKIFDIVGREVKTLLDNKLLGTSGAISWDGIMDTGDLARMGPYVVYLEAFDLNGNVEKFKETVVLAHKL